MTGSAGYYQHVIDDIRLSVGLPSAALGWRYTGV